MTTQLRKKGIKLICFLLIFCPLFLFFQKLFQAKWIANIRDSSGLTSTWIEYRNLEPDTVDVFFVGTSHVYSAIDPMYIYSESGITSFALAGPGLREDLSYQVLKEAFRTQSPSVVLMDMSSIHFSEQQSEAKIHKVLDQLPITGEKINYALTSNSQGLPPLDALFPFFRYHSRWTNLRVRDFEYASGSLKGGFCRGHFISYKTVPTKYHFNKKVDFTLQDRDVEYLKRIKKLCEENGANMILYKIPAPTWYKSQSKSCEKLAETLGVPWLELYYKRDEIGLDPAVDFRDKHDHLNQNGCEKLCRYLIGYLEENYQLEDQRATNQQWNKDLKKYLRRLKKIKKQ